MNFDKDKYRIWTWKHPLMLHWIINPALAVNEFFMGQRIPKVILIERNRIKGSLPTSIAPYPSFVPCPHCGTLHEGAKWSPQNKTAFKNWFGLYCDNCGQIIPCLTNLTTYLLLGLTFPIRYWYKERWKQEWLAEQKKRFAEPLKLETPNVLWWSEGLQFGFTMYVINTFITLPLIDGECVTTERILTNLPIWIISGLVFGLFMKWTTGGFKKEK